MNKGTKYTYPITLGDDAKIAYRINPGYGEYKGKRSHLRINKVSSFFGSASSNTHSHWIVWYRQVIRFGKLYVIYKLVRRDLEEEFRKDKEKMEKFNANDVFKTTPENILKVIKMVKLSKKNEEGYRGQMYE